MLPFIDHIIRISKANELMSTENNKNSESESERRANDRRQNDDRRNAVRFGDVLGRRTGVDRRVTTGR